MARRKTTLAQESVRHFDRKAREQIRSELNAIKLQKKELAVKKKQKQKQARHYCKSSKVRVRARAKAVRAEYRARAVADIDRLIEASGAACTKNLNAINSQVDKASKRLDMQARELRSYQRQVYTLGAKRERALAKAETQRAPDESDRDVLANLDPELHELFRERAKVTKKKARMSRTEVFLQWVHDHPEAVEAALAGGDDAYASELDKLDKQSAALWDLLGSKGAITLAQLRRAGVDPEKCNRLGLDCQTRDGLEQFATVPPEF